MFVRSFTFFVFLAIAGFSLPAAAVAPFVEGRWLEKHLNDARLAIVDMSDEGQYQRFHLPGAIRLPYQALVKRRLIAATDEKTKNGAGKMKSASTAAPVDKPAIPVRLDNAELAKLLGQLGITRDKYVVIYDDVGGLNAGRLFWELERIGHPKVSVLEGGLVKWILEGRKVVNNAPLPRPTAYTLGEGGRDNEAQIDDVQRAAATRDALLLDVRTPEEYLGAPNKPRTGHVVGAQFWPWEQALNIPKGFTRADESALRQSLARVGVRERERPVILYCQSGHRAAQTYLTLRSLGFDNVRLYANSMNEYALLPDRPLKQGAKP
ncbi:MAG: sulfurtransferase [Pseudomonadota bacterium]|nr:MAG: sulfurtransferase [Pseudomonadota bacterium]